MPPGAPLGCSHCCMRAGAVCGALQHCTVCAHVLLRQPAGERPLLPFRSAACTEAVPCAAGFFQTAGSLRCLVAPSQVWFGVEIMLDWALRSYSKLTTAGEPGHAAAGRVRSQRPAACAGPESPGNMADRQVPSAGAQPRLLPFPLPPQSTRCCGPPLAPSCSGGWRPASRPAWWPPPCPSRTHTHSPSCPPLGWRLAARASCARRIRRRRWSCCGQRTWCRHRWAGGPLGRCFTCACQVAAVLELACSSPHRPAASGPRPP